MLDIMKTFSDNLVQALQEAGLSQSDLARRIGVKPQAVQYLCNPANNARGSKYLHQIARELGVREDWLLTGRGPKDRRAQQNYMPGPSIRGTVPVISWVQAGSMTEVIDLHEPGFADEWVETTAPIHDHTFALRVQGDSMAPEFPDGTIIVVEPEMDWSPGDYVIAKNGGEATFKQLVQDGPDLYLKPLNDRYPIKPLGESVVIGVVREQIKRYR
ncbi:MAG: LexA family protein [Halothiobacillaceae bacterium]